MSVSQTIFEQLGGKRFQLMTGARELVGSVDGLQFKIGKNSSKATHVNIYYDDAEDLYLVQFWKMTPKRMTLLKEYHGVYNDQLTGLFTEVTGLYTNLGI